MQRLCTRYACLSCALLWLALTSGCSGSRQAQLAPGSVVLALGDSITSGHGVALEEAWPALLSRRCGWRIVNAGVSGDTSAGARQRLGALIAEHSPRLVIVEIGGNDMLRRAAETEIIANIAAMIEIAQRHQLRVVLLAIPQPSALGAATGRLAPAGFYASLADQTGVMVIEDAVSEVLSDATLRLDPVHPNRAGHAALSDKIETAFRASGLLR